MTRSEQLLQRLMSELILRQEDIRRNSCATSVSFKQLETSSGAFAVEVAWKDGKYQKVFDRLYVFGDVPVGAENVQHKVCWYWRDIVRGVLQYRGVM